jgi:transposase InsO family protein
MTRQNYYARRKLRKRRGLDGELVARLVKQERCLQPRLGTRKMRVLLREPLAKAGVQLGRDRFFEVLREHDLLLARRRSERPRTTHSYHSLPVFRNLVKGRQAQGANEIWVGDLTYLRSEEGFMFLSLLTDKVSRHVVGYHCGDSLESIGCQEALKMALKQLKAGQQPIHHSDRGSQYCCHDYVDLASSRGLTMSMTEEDHCAENALAERMNGILKSEYGLDREFKTKAQLTQAVDQAIRLYGTRRPHTVLGDRFPAQVHQHLLLPPAPLLRAARRLGPRALRHELRTKVQSPARVGATPAADQPVEPLRGELDQVTSAPRK